MRASTPSSSSGNCQVNEFVSRISSKNLQLDQQLPWYPCRVNFLAIMNTSSCKLREERIVSGRSVANKGLPDENKGNTSEKTGCSRSRNGSIDPLMPVLVNSRVCLKINSKHMICSHVSCVNSLTNQLQLPLANTFNKLKVTKPSLLGTRSY